MVIAGHEGGWWELGRMDYDVDFIEDVVRSVIAGRAGETFAPRRSRVDVTLGDGTVVHETGRDGCLSVLGPLVGWTRWGRQVRYLPYG
jgi:hypothetical protein